MSEEEAVGTAGGGDATWRTIMLIMMALLGAAVLVGLLITLGGANRQRDRALQLQAHSYDVMILARTLSGTIARSEASLGRYVISTNRDFGQLYYDDWRLAGTQLNRLDVLTNDNPDQQPRIDSLRQVYEARGREMSLTALTTNYGKNDQALSRYYALGRAASLPKINVLLDEIIKRERTLLDARTADAMRTVDRSSRVAGVLAIFGILIVLAAILLGWLTIRVASDRATARADADEAHQRAEELTEAVNQATDELRIQEAKLRQVQKMEAVGQLTGGIAHDFNNMLAVVLGGLELARRAIDSDPATAARHLDNATEGADRAAALTRRLLAFSREDSLKPEPIGAATLVSGMSELLDRTLGDAVTIVTRDEAGGWCVRADRVQLENAILNLAVNARDAMSGRGVLTIATAAVTLKKDAVGHCASGDYVSIAVTDNGCGMTPEIVERVYEPFFTTKAVGKGTGLGLSQIFALVRQLDGEIAIRTAPGDGTTVTLYLPREIAAASDGDVVAMPISPPVPTATSLTILVVEDDPRVMAAALGALEELGHVGIACDDPFAAGALLERHGEIDLIMSDVLMPGQTGPEMIAELAPRFPHVAVLFVTGFAGEANATEFVNREVLRKPFTLSALEQAVAAAMARERPEAPEQLAAA